MSFFIKIIFLKELHFLYILINLFFYIDLDKMPIVHPSPSSMNIKDFAYEELLLSVIADKIRKNTAKETINATAEYIAFEVLVDSSYPWSTGILMSILTGNSLCSSQSFVLMNILKKNGIIARPFYSKNHVLVEFFLKDKWIPLDPFGGIIFKDKKGNFLSWQEAQAHLNDFNFIESSIGKMELVIPREQLMALLINGNSLLFPHTYLEPDSTYRDTKFYFVFVSYFVHYGYRIFGEEFLRIAQEAYLKYLHKNIGIKKAYFHFLNKDTETVDEVILPLLNFIVGKDEHKQHYEYSFRLLKARHYHVVGFLNRAQEIYQKIFDKNETTIFQSYAGYSLAKLLYEKKDYRKSIKILDKVIRINDELELANKASFYLLGLCYEALEDYSKAYTAYTQSVKCQRKSDEWAFKIGAQKLYKLEHIAPANGTNRRLNLLN